MTPRKLTARGEAARAQAMATAKAAAARSRRKRAPWVPEQAARVAQQRAAAPPQPLPPETGEKGAQQ